MKTIAYFFALCSLIIFASALDVQGRGGRGGGGRGGGGFGGGRGGGGYSRPAPSRSPSMSRPSTSRPNYSRPSTSRPSNNRPSTRPSAPPSRPSGSRPNTGTRPGAGSRPGTGTRPGQNGRPTKSQLDNFLNIPNNSSGRPGTEAGNRPAGGGAAGDFLRDSNGIQRPTTDRTGNRSDRVNNRTENRTNRAENRSNRRENGPVGNRPERIENRGERQTQRNERRNEVRDQFHDNHPRYDFWKDHPNWARFRWNRPYRWATWGLIVGWFPGYGAGATEYDYDYGENIYYQDDQVYYGDEVVATADEYAEQAQELAESVPEVDESSEWLSLGVFAMTKDDEDSGPPPTLFIQLAVNKQGIIAGTFSNTTTDKTQPLEGMVDQKNQRVAWGVEGKKWPIMETGLANLTKDTSAALVHFENGQTQQWLLVRIEEPTEDQQKASP